MGSIGALVGVTTFFPDFGVGEGLEALAVAVGAADTVATGVTIGVSMGYGSGIGAVIGVFEVGVPSQ